MMENTTVDILGTEYTIINEEFKDNECDGYCDYTSKEIHIRNDNVNDVGNFDYLTKKQLRHEIIHAFLSESGLQANYEHYKQFGHEETIVDWFAIQSPKIFKAFMKLGILGVHETQDEVIMYGADGKLDRVKTRPELLGTIQCSTKHTVHCDSDKVIDEINRAVNDKIKHDIRANGE